MSEKLFPPYLNKGSQGPAVSALQLLLIGGGYTDPDLVVDGDYGDRTATAVRRLQEKLDGIDVDGNFGPATRAAYLEKYGFDVNSLPQSVFTGKIVSVPTPVETQATPVAWAWSKQEKQHYGN